MGIVYKIVGPNIFPYKSKIYIGSAVDEKLQKWNQHEHELLQIYGYSSQMVTLIQKYERINFDITVLEYCHDDNIPQRIVYWIKHYKCMFPYGNNVNINLAPDTLLQLPDYIHYIVHSPNSTHGRHGYIVDYLPANKHLHVMIEIDKPMTPEILKIAKLYLHTLISEHISSLCNAIVPCTLPQYKYKKNVKIMQFND